MRANERFAGLSKVVVVRSARSRRSFRMGCRSFQMSCRSFRMECRSFRIGCRSFREGVRRRLRAVTERRAKRQHRGLCIKNDSVRIRGERSFCRCGRRRCGGGGMARATMGTISRVLFGCFVFVPQPYLSDVVPGLTRRFVITQNK